MRAAKLISGETDSSGAIIGEKKGLDLLLRQ